MELNIKSQEDITKKLASNILPFLQQLSQEYNIPILSLISSYNNYIVSKCSEIKTKKFVEKLSAWYLYSKKYSSEILKLNEFQIRCIRDFISSRIFKSEEEKYIYFSKDPLTLLKDVNSILFR